MNNDNYRFAVIWKSKGGVSIKEFVDKANAADSAAHAINSAAYAAHSAAYAARSAAHAARRATYDDKIKQYYDVLCEMLKNLSRLEKIIFNIL